MERKQASQTAEERNISQNVHVRKSDTTETYLIFRVNDTNTYNLYIGLFTGKSLIIVDT